MAKVKINQILDIANGILEDVYGYRITKLPPKEIINGKGSRKESTQQHWILTKTLQNDYLKFIQEASWLNTSKSLFYSELNEVRHDYRNNKEDFPTFKSDQDLITSGIVLTIVSLIIVHSNKMNEPELLGILHKEFGLDLNKTIPVIEATPQEFLKTLDKMDYVNRLVVAIENGEPVVEYSVGRRAKSEFTKEDFITFLRILYDVEEDAAPEFVVRMGQSLEPVFGK
jgi:TPP-dependent indolepyruvate ferredoxin oxidoreductase alpha subunit